MTTAVPLRINTKLFSGYMNCVGFCFQKSCLSSIVYLLARPLPAEPERRCTSAPRTSGAPPAPLTSGHVWRGKPGSASAAPLWTHTHVSVQFNCGPENKQRQRQRQRVVVVVLGFPNQPSTAKNVQAVASGLLYS